MSVRILTGDCIDEMRKLDAASVDAIVTDPPYGLEFMGKAWDSPWKDGIGTGEHNAGFSKGAPAVAGVRGEIRALPSFMGSTNPTCRNCGGTRNGNDRESRKACRCANPSFPNTTLPRMVAFQQWCDSWAIECLRVLKPGGHLLAFGGTRTYHRLACGLEDAGFEIRDSIHWVYGSGFPKSLNLPNGLGTALKPAHEPIVLARKALVGTVAANVAAHGTGALNVDASRVGTSKDVPSSPRRASQGEAYGDLSNASGDTSGFDAGVGRWPPNLLLSHTPECVEDGACAEDCAVAEMDRQSGSSFSSGGRIGNKDGGSIYGGGKGLAGEFVSGDPGFGDSGGASRFFPVFRYEAKPSRAEREAGLTGNARSVSSMSGRREADRMDEFKIDNDVTARFVKRARNTHPTVKPIALMAWLVQLVAREGQTVLDPFLGSGTTAIACARVNVSCIGIEREAEYVALAEKRIRGDAPLFASVRHS